MIESRTALPMAADHGVSVARDAGGKFGESPYARRKRSMNIKLYKTDLRPELNEVFDDITLFLADLQPKHQWANVKYTKPELDIMIKLPLDGTYNHLGQFDYCDLFDEQANKHYYYYILNTNWKAKQTLQLQLSMDTLNTFWQEIKATIGPNTHVTRRYFDRWKKVGTKAYPLIDKHPEEISAPPMVQIAKPKVVGPTKRWTLVYRTEYDSDVKVNPASCYAIPSVDTQVQTTTYGPYTLSKNAAAQGTWWVMNVGSNDGDTFSFVNSYGTSKSYTVDNVNSAGHAQRVAIVIENGEIGVYIYRTPAGEVQESHKTQEVVFTKCRTIFRQSSTFNANMNANQYDYTNPFVINGGMTNGTLQSFDSWYEVNKTDTRLIKIIELPYAPFDEKTDSSGKMIIPDGFDMYYGLLRYNGAISGMESSVASFDNLGPEPFVISDVVNEQGIQKKANPEEYETKLWNSSYYCLKYIYDNQAKPIKLEEFEHLAVPSYSLNINFYPSTGMDNSIAFEFKSTEQLDTDFGDWLIANRTTEIPYYTNEWLNYLRFGKAVDERNKGFSIASTVAGGIGSTAQTSASLAFAIAGAKIGSLTGLAGAGIGAGVGLVTSVIATASSIYKTNDQINSKIDQYTHQASSVSASNDLSVFRKYGKNKLLQVEYQPTKELRDSIGRYFHLYGYSCDEYGVPNWNTRIWSEYYVMEPDFLMSYIEKDYEADISTRMQAGFRLLHRVNLSDRSGVYDFDSEYENFERSLLA